MVTMFMGRKAEDWAQIDDSMRKRNIKNAVQLEDRLKKAEEKQKRDPMEGRVEIRDSKNLDRVLGSVSRPHGNSPKLDGGDCYNMAVMGRLSCNPFKDPFYDPRIDMSVSHVRFGFRCVNWNVVLTTDASLALLAQIRDFRFPGETEEQAHCRNMYAY